MTAPVKRKRQWIATLLAVLFGSFGLFGIGHLYVGRLARGLLLLFGGSILVILSWVPVELELLGAWGHTPFFWIISAVVYILWSWQSFDAWKVCRQHNLQEAAFEAGVQNAVSRKAFGKGVTKAGSEKWSRKALAVGAGRYGPGAQEDC